MGRKKSDYIPTSYEQAKEILAGGRRKDGWRTVKGKRSTVLVGEYIWKRNPATDDVYERDAKSPVIRLRYHLTNVVTFMPDGSVVVDTNGFSTRTTQERINSCGIPLWGLYSKNGFTLIGEGDPFVDGIVLGPAPDRQVLGVMDHRGAIQPYPPFVRYTAQCMVATRWYRQLPDPMKWRILIYAMSDDAPNPQSQFQSQPQPQLATA